MAEQEKQIIQNMNEEYCKKEQEFMMTEALCDNVPPAQCDCSKCPAQQLCNWLEENDLHRF